MIRLAAALALLSGCAVASQITARNDDLEDYRSYRVAAHEGVRLARAQRYVENHPSGTWIAEVRAAFDGEEPAFFERAKDTRSGASMYLTHLPRGPHADAALSLLTAYDTKVEDVETARLLVEARRSEAMLDKAAAGRRVVGEFILLSVGALLDPDVYGARVEDAPAPLLHALDGATRPTWGRTAPVREEDFYFTIPLLSGRESRVVTVVVTASLKNGLIEEGRVEGTNLFVHWDEADHVRSLDPTSPNHRAAAAFHATELVAGAIEARLPAARCTPSAERAAAELLVRRCDGWSVVVTWAETPADRDRIVIRGPSTRK